MSVVTSIDALAEEAHRRIDHAGAPCPGPDAHVGREHEKDGASDAAEDHTVSGPSLDAGGGSSGQACETATPGHAIHQGTRDPMRSRKRRRGLGPPETCPYCGHVYTVRDGLSAKLDADGNRLHQRKCQCRVKTPPCRNCPTCKYDEELMDITDAEAQQLACQQRGCPICACSCPSTGKWIEGDEPSRLAFKERTARRAGQLQVISQQLLSGETGLQDREAAGPPPSWSVKRLPADIRSSLSALQQQRRQDAPRNLGDPRPQDQTLPAEPSNQEREVVHEHHCEHPHADCTSACCSAPGTCAEHAVEVEMGGWTSAATFQPDQPDQHQLVAHLLKRLLMKRDEGGSCFGSGGSNPCAQVTENVFPRSGEQTQPSSQATLSKAQKPLPSEVADLARRIFEPSLGVQGAEAVCAFLSEQCVAGLDDLEFLELDWMISALQPRGVPPLLLNKFLTMGRRMAGGGHAS